MFRNIARIACSLTVVATAPVVAAAQPARATVQIRGDTSRVLPAAGEEIQVLDLARRINMINAFFSQTVNEMRPAPAVPERLNQVRFVRELQNHLADAVGQLDLLCQGHREARAPFIGIEVTETYNTAAANIVQSRYPTIVRVIDGSPARRAGLDSGDVIMSVNGVDLLNSPLSSYAIEPGKTLELRLSRAGQVRSASVLPQLMEKPVSRACEVTERTRIEAYRHDSTVARRLGLQPRLTFRAISASRPPGDTAGNVYAVAPSPTQVFIMLTTAPSSVSHQTFLGALLMDATPQMLKQSGAPMGVRVVKVAEGSVGYKYGLRDNDIVVRVGKAAVENMARFQEAVDKTTRESRQIEFEVVRDSRNITISVPRFNP